MSDIGSVNEWAKIANNEAPDNLHPVFHKREIVNKRRSDEDGRPRFDLVDYVAINIPGNKNSRPVQKVTEEHKIRWARQWEQYEKREEQIAEGTPINQWPYLNLAQVAEFKALGILTVEALVSMPDSNIKALGIGGRDTVKRAKQFLQPQSERETDLRKEIKDQEIENKNLRVEMDGLKTRLEAMDAKFSQMDADEYDEAIKRRRGRPKKAA